MSFYCYIVRCADRSLYVGHCRDLDARLRAHNAGEGAVFTAARSPLTLVWHEPQAGEAAAVRREQQIKRWSRAKKEALVANRLNTLRAFSRSREHFPPL